MTQNEIIEMAKQAGIEEAYSLEHSQVLVRYKDGSLEAFAKLVAEREREECAMECIKKANEWTRLGAWGSNNEFHQCAEAIRARGEP